MQVSGSYPRLNKSELLREGSEPENPYVKSPIDESYKKWNTDGIPSTMIVSLGSHIQQPNHNLCPQDNNRDGWK